MTSCDHRARGICGRFHRVGPSADTPEKLASDLLHELVLHAIPAYRAHLHRGTGAPQFTEEAADHADQGSWCEMIRLAIHGAQWGVAQAAILDCLAHSDENGFTEEEQEALELLHERDWDGLRAAGWL